jgi:8-oxo-dGTP diphosphatase
MTEPILKVAAKAAIIRPDGKLLLLRESPRPSNSQAGRWGLAGGQLEPGEAFIDALHREVREETGLTVEPVRPLYVGEWRPGPLQIVGVFMLCRTRGSEVILSDEHDNYAWIHPGDLHNYELMDPDNHVIESVVQRLRDPGLNL